MSTAIQFEGVTRSFGSFTAVRDLSFVQESGRFVAVVGPSGCGKSTLLNLAAGLLRPGTGEVRIFGESLNTLNRSAAYMFQQDTLLPWKTVVENIALAKEFLGTPPSQARSSAIEWVQRVGLTGFENSYPSQLSGGMRKRASMAQCFLTGSRILLMDEPFSALDVHTRMRMQSVLLDLWTESPKSVLFVTHDLEEAISLADEILVLSAGPASKIVGRFALDLERPRDLIDIRTEPRFTALYREIWSLLREEVLRSYEPIA